MSAKSLLYDDSVFRGGGRGTSTRRFGLEKLTALREREEAMHKASGIVPGDLTETSDFQASAAT